MLTQKKLLAGGWQVEVPTLFKSFLVSLCLVPRSFLFFSLSLVHKIRWGAQGVSRVVTGKSGLHARVEWERVIDLESW